MKKNSNDTAHRIPGAYILLFVIIFLQLFRIVYSFTCLKDDFHADEGWSFGLANSHYEPYIYQDADENGFTHQCEWFSSDVFRSYLTVDQDQRFDYSSVWYNQSKDLHPPLYYSILHTICSFFPGQFSFWYGFSINIVVFIILQIFLFMLIRELVHSDITALSGCILYGFSTGALNTFVFVRMYAMMTMFAVITSYLHTKMFNTKNQKKYLPPIFFITVAGCLTHHYFIAFAGILSACFCFFYLFSKKIKQLIIYGVTMLSAVGLSVLIFPATINHLFFRRGHITLFTPSWQLRLSLNCVLSEIFCINVSLISSPLPIIILIVLGCCTAILLPLVFLFRNETWFKKSVTSVRKKSIDLTKTVWHKIHHMNLPVLFILIASIGIIITTSATISFIDMGLSTDRYMFVIYPSVCTVSICFFYYFVKWSIKSKKVQKFLILTFSCTMCLSTAMGVPSMYLYQNTFQSTQISSVIKNSNCMFISNEYWLLTSLTKDALNSKEIFAATPEMLINIIDDISTPDNDSPVYLLVNDDVYETEDEQEDTIVLYNTLPISRSKSFNKYSKEDFEKIIRQLPFCSEFTYIGRDTVFERRFTIYKIS